MPFLKGGREAVTQTKRYLDKGRIVFKNRVKIFSINHIPDNGISDGANKFVSWFLPQIQYKNPTVQVITFQKITPTPFIRCYLDKDEEITIDLSFKKSEDIHDHVKEILGKTATELRKETMERQEIINPALFGESFPRQCICEVYGQIPCPCKAGYPKHFVNLTEENKLKKPTV